MEIHIIVEVDDPTAGMPQAVRKLFSEGVGAGFSLGFGNEIGKVEQVSLDSTPPTITVRVPLDQVHDSDLAVATMFVLDDPDTEVTDKTDHLEGRLAQIVLDISDDIATALGVD